jgi:sugar transferase (PEP-CTERM/EpsH1 system associated)
MKKILMISSRVPYPLTSGYKIRVYNLGKILSKYYNVDLITADAEGIGNKYISALKKVFNEVIVFNLDKITCLKNLFAGIFLNRPLQVSLYYSKELQKWFDVHYREYDLIWCVYIRTAVYTKNIKIDKIIDLTDAISLHYQRAYKNSNLLWKAIYKEESRRVLPYEMNCLKSFDKAFVVSDVDKEYLENNFRRIHHTSSTPNLSTLSMGINEKVFLKSKYDIKEENWITFLGKMDYAPNVDAVVYFVKQIFPLIKKQNKEIKFMIVGTSPSKKVKSLQDIEGVKVTGFVEDPYMYLRKSKVVVAPIRFGAGIQNKVLEAMGLGKAVVTTPIVAKSIGAKNNFNIMIAKTDKEFYKKIMLLLGNANLRTEIGSRAKDLIERKYRWDVIEKELLNEVNNVLGIDK